MPERPVISVFLDFHLKLLVTKAPHILEDTRDFLTRITEIKDLPALLVSLDIVGLYPHIPHEEGIKTEGIFTKSLCDLATIILKNIYH